MSRFLARGVVATLVGVVAAGFVVGGGNGAVTGGARSARLVAAPLSFAQAPDGSSWVATGHGYSIVLRSAGADLALRRGHMRVRVVGAAPARLHGRQRLAGKVNWYLGSDRSKWRSGVPTYARVSAGRVLPGVDLSWYGRAGRLEYDLRLAAGTDPGSIRMRFDGAERVTRAANGDLVVGATSGKVRELRPVAYQLVNGRRVHVASDYVVDGRTVGFRLGAFDSRRPLVIDPQLVWGTYLGGSLDEFPGRVGRDSAGNLYIAGETGSTNFPTLNPTQSNPGASSPDDFVAKFGADGTLLYSTYLGGNGVDRAKGLAVDSAGNAWVVGETTSSNWPTVGGPFQGVPGSAGVLDASVARLDPSGVLTYGSYLGGSGQDTAYAVAVDSSGNAYVAGSTQSTTNFPTVSPFQATHGGGSTNPEDAFVTKFAANGTVPYSTYLGGSGDDFAYNIAVDGAANMYVTGTTPSANFPGTSGGTAGGNDAFVTEIAASGSSLVFSRYLGGSGQEYGYGIAVDASGNVYVAGDTSSPNFPTASPLQGALNGTSDAFAAKLAAGTGAATWSTYLGGSGSDQASNVVLDGAGNVWVAGQTSADFPTTNPLQAANAGSTDAFLAELNNSGSAFVFSTLFGGGGFDYGQDVVVDPSGNAFLFGYTESTNLPTANARQGTNAGSADAFLAEIAPTAPTGTGTGPGSGTSTSPTTTTGPTTSTPPAPVFAVSGTATPVSGTVLVKLPGASKFVAVSSATRIPVGSIVDASKGRVRIAILGANGKLSTADFYQGVFKFTQPRNLKGIADMRLFGGNFKKLCRATKAGLALAARGKSVRHLWGSGSGPFRTTGRYASATIRGTTWDTDDRCDGTLVKVTQGAVTVRDLVRKKSVVLKAKHQYFAAAKR